MAVCQLISHELGVKSQFDLTWGTGFDWQRRIATFVRPAGSRRIRINFAASGTTIVGTNYEVNSIATAKTFVRPTTGDVVAFGGGTTISNLFYGDMSATGGGGINKTFPTRFTTYNPAAPLDETQDGTLRVLWSMDATATTQLWGNQNAVFSLANRPNSDYFCFEAIDFIGDTNGSYDKLAVGMSKGTNTNQNGQLIQNCTFNNLGLVMQGFSATLTNTNIPAQPDSAFMLDVTIRKCGSNDGIGSNRGFIYITGARNITLHDNVHCRSGRGAFTQRPQGADAGEPLTTTGLVDPGNNTTGIVVTAGACNSSGTTITMASTTGITAGMRCWTYTALGGTGSFFGSPFGSGEVLQVLNGTQVVVNDIQAALVNIGVAFSQVGGNYLRHTWYLDNDNSNFDLRRNVSIMENANNKFAGGPYYIEDHWNIRDPIGFITDPCGNDAGGTAVSFPTGIPLVVHKNTLVGADDISTGTWAGVPNQRGWGPQLQAGSIGSRVSGAVMMNNNSPTPGTRVGIAGNSNNRPYQSYAQFDNLVSIGWQAGQDNTAQTNLIKSFLYCITDDAPGYLNTTNGSGSAVSSGANNVNRGTSFNFMASVSMEDTFRQANPYLLANTTVVNGNATFNDQSATIRNMGNLMASPTGITSYNWADELAKTFRNQLGR